MDTSSVVGQNYTGPYISNGKFQTSVLFGDRAPLSELDSLSRLHDSAYAYYGPGLMRKAADSLYNERTSKLDGATPYLAGKAVLYGNAGMHSLGNLVNSTATGFKFAGLPGAVGGLVYGGVRNMIDLYDYMSNSTKAKHQVTQFERNDPFPQFQLGPRQVDLGPPSLEGMLAKGGKGLKVDAEDSSRPTRPTGSPAPAATKVSLIHESPVVDDTLTNVEPLQWLGGGEFKTMVKKDQKKKKTVTVAMPKVPKQKQRTKTKNPKPASLGAISTISTAPVAIGNSIRGCENVVVGTGKNGILVRGRDFMFAPIATGSVTTWTVCGGSPLSPAAFADTTLATYMRLYAKYRFRSIIAHYITSSPTSANGDVMFYYAKDRSSVLLNQTSPQLLGFVLSDPNTVIGPQWTNHSAEIKITGGWKLTDYGMHSGIEEYADGELFLLSKTSTTDSPGYVLFDYIIEFAEHQLQPRLLTFPIPRIQWHQTNIGLTAVAVGINEAVGYVNGLSNGAPVLKGNNISGTLAVLPPGAVVFDVFKIFLDVTNSNAAAWVGCTTSNLLNAQSSGAGSTSIGIVDGTTLYAVYLGTNRFQLYLSADQAFNAPAAAGTTGSGVVYGVTAAVTYNLQIWMSYIGSNNSTSVNPNY